MNGNNPLYGLKIGSTINATTGKFSVSVVKGNISRMDPQKEATKTMTGQSGYVYSDVLNQGSLGVSGSYGVSGISKVKSSLSAYAGQAAAKSSKSIDVNYNVVVTTGVEYIDFDDLQVSDVLTALKDGPQQSALASLSAYLALQSELNALGVGLLKVIGSTDPAYQKANGLFASHLTSVSNFNRLYGDGLIVGVLWGGLGTVTMNMGESNNSQTWKYGGAAAFSYAGVGASVSVEATYDGGQSDGRGEVKVQCDHFFSGACVEELVDKWFDVVSGKSFAALANVDVMKELPSLSNAKGAPAIPEFEKPSPKKSITDKIGEIKDLNGLQALAKASAYEEAKEKNKTLTLDQFLAEADQKANTKGLTELQEQVDQNSLPVLQIKSGRHDSPSDSPDLPGTDEATADGVGLSDYVPLGIWLANWADLFPWLAAGYCNDVIGMAEVSEMLKYRMMIQDFQALAKMYYMADEYKLLLFPARVAGQIADSFANQCSLLQAKETLSRTSEAFDGLSESAKKIYRKWDELRFLRNCELGLGLVLDGKVSIENRDPTKYAAGDVHYPAVPCEFRAGDHADYSAFARVMKVFPLIGPTGNLHVFGPSNEVLWAFHSGGFFFDKGERASVTFEANMAEKILESKPSLKAYPIPFKASSGIPWKGPSLSTNLSSMKELRKQLADVNIDLGRLNAWTFSSEAWNADWTPETYYALNSIRTQYMGLIPEKGNIF